MSNERKTFDTFNQLRPLLFVISGHSGAGKDTVIQRMREKNIPIHFVITATTRPPRDNEQHGVDYFFVSDDEFAKMIKAGDLIEYAIVYNEYKGVPREQVDNALWSGKDVVMRVDVQGAASIRKLYPNAVLIFLVAKDEDELIRRLKNRKSETPEDLRIRIDTARQELERISEFDYLVVNEDSHLNETVNTISAIIEAEHHKIQKQEGEN